MKGDDGSQGLLGMREGGPGSELILAGPHANIGTTLNSSDPEHGLFLNNDSGTPVGEMAVAERGGRFWLGDNSGNGMIEGGVTEGGRGVWRAGPETGGPIDMPGLPFAILGKK